jgi:hypothetical protein
MKRRLQVGCITVGLVGACLGGVAAAAPSKTATLAVHLTPGQVVPKQTVKVPDASGTFSATLTKTAKGYTMNWRLSYAKLSGEQAWTYIHKGKAGKFGAALYVLCNHCKSGATGKIYVSPWAFRLMQAGGAYVNVRTTANPAGEIRGQIAIKG